MRHEFARDEAEWLVAHYPSMTNDELAAAFAEMFGAELSRKQLLNFSARHGLNKTDEVRRRAIRLSRGGMSAEQEEFMRSYAPWHSWRDTSVEFERRFGRALKKSDVHNMKKKLGLRSQIPNPGEYRKGQAPWNRGKSWDEQGLSESAKARMRAAQWRPGECNAHNEGKRRHLLDMHHDSRCGWRIYVNPRDAKNTADRWISYGRFVWMQANGREVPEDCYVIHADRDGENFDPDNLVLIPLELYPIVVAGNHGHALPYHDRATLELAIDHARLTHARVKLEKRLREARS